MTNSFFIKVYSRFHVHDSRWLTAWARESYSCHLLAVWPLQVSELLSLSVLIFKIGISLTAIIF